MEPHELLKFIASHTREELWERAHAVKEAETPKVFDFCAILSARQGKCPENCKWCAQSAQWKTACENHDWVGTEACVKAAQEAEQQGAVRFGIVTSGRGQTPEQIDEICMALKAIGERTRIHRCASLGLLSKDDLVKLKAAGLQRLHCNLETASRRFEKLCTTHTVEEKFATLRAAKELGLEICCGGIIGMGETQEELVEFAYALRSVEPDSIPVNILHPIAGTPLGETLRLDFPHILTAIAIIKLANPTIPLRFAGGRRDLTDDEARRCVYVGISAGIAGPLLTTPGGDYDDDRQLAQEAGMEIAHL